MQELAVFQYMVTECENEVDILLEDSLITPSEREEIRHYLAQIQAIILDKAEGV